MDLLLTLLLAAAVKDPGATLRAGCQADTSAVAQLPAGTAITIRYSLSGESVPCYKVSVNSDGEPAEGYLTGPEIDGLETFDSARKKGGVVQIQEVLSAVIPPKAASGGAGSLAHQAASLIESSRPAQALALLEPEIKRRPDAGLLALAGAAAWRADDPKRALDLWRQSQKLQPNQQVKELMLRVERETQGDHSDQRLYGTRILLRYEGTAITVDTAREMAAVLDGEYARISAQLGCSGTERIVTIAQSASAYKKTTAAAEWSAGQYDGRIHVPVFDKGSLDANTRRTLAHETVHACLTMLGRWPAWLHEGIAQYISGQTLPAADRDQITQLARAHKLPALAKLDGDWSTMDAGSARVAYNLALRAIEIFQQDFGAYGLRNLLKNPDKLPYYAGEIDRRFGL
ncbi:MAG: hypothetical protein WDO18_21260 [Acidobacteriota bacterium]